MEGQQNNGEAKYCHRFHRFNQCDQWQLTTALMHGRCNTLLRILLGELLCATKGGEIMGVINKIMKQAKYYHRFH